MRWFLNSYPHEIASNGNILIVRILLRAREFIGEAQMCQYDIASAHRNTSVDGFCRAAEQAEIYVIMFCTKSIRSAKSPGAQKSQAQTNTVVYYYSKIVLWSVN